MLNSVLLPWVQISHGVIVGNFQRKINKFMDLVSRFQKVKFFKFIAGTDRSLYKYRCRTRLLAGDQWWLRPSGGRLRFVRSITYLLRHRFGNFVKGNKRNLHNKD